MGTFKRKGVSLTLYWLDSKMYDCTSWLAPNFCFGVEKSKEEKVETKYFKPGFDSVPVHQHVGKSLVKSHSLWSISSGVVLQKNDHGEHTVQVFEQITVARPLVDFSLTI